MIIRQNTPLRYPGGKAKFSPYIKCLMKEYQLVGGHYVEPFAGGAGVALEVLFSKHSTDIHINDIDPAIYDFWNSLVNQTDDFLRLLNDTEVTVSEWHKQKAILDNPQEYSRLDHGFAALFLNRTNRSGILKAGIIGGKAQTGAYKIDARFQKKNLIRKIEKIAEYSSRIHTYNLDAVDFLRKIDRIIPDKSLIYLDPPYYVKGQGLYRNYYTHEDHVEIQQALINVKNKWIVSYDNCDEIRDLYSSYRQDEYLLNYSAYHKKKGAEVMIFCEEFSDFTMKIGSLNVPRPRRRASVSSEPSV
ncbi:DNA adenine methylase [Ochrobactrum sp. AN78]|uniref:DNA adenine methylase n=1 Tax=Ochrobactrum sp. AN78 TaxID=3039853 RepID=UPI002989E62D|nr:DNA adenine methylase [Ochrobactrum sp. AN78]MDH7790745.1 DNA adenine methylase [Ochrobactrum sp. AN78]